MNTTNTLTELLPSVRVTSQMRSALDEIVARSITKNISDHVRYALEQYIEAHEVSEPQKAPSLPAR